MKPKVIAIVGPTASGKTKMAIDLAKQVDGEVISADSRYVIEVLILLLPNQRWKKEVVFHII